MHHCVATYGRLLLVIGVAGWLASGLDQWQAIGPALLGAIALAISWGPLRSPSGTVAAVAGVLIACLALFCSAGAVADMPAPLAGDGTQDGFMTLSRSLTSLVSLAVLLALGAQWLQSQRKTGT